MADSPRASKGFNGAADTKGFDFRITGDQTPYLELSLDPGKEIITESGDLMAKTSPVGIDTKFGDGSNPNAGFGSKLWGAVKRAVAGSNMMMTVFNNKAATRQTLALSTPIPGSIIALNLAEQGGSIQCQRGSFMAAPKGVHVDVGLTKKIGFGLFGGDGFVMEKLSGDDWVFLNAGGSIAEYTLQAGESLDVESGHLVAASKDVSLDISTTGIKAALFSGDGLFLARATGPGKVWVQSMPFSRLASVIGAALAPRFANQGGGNDNGGISIGGIKISPT